MEHTHTKDHLEINKIQQEQESCMTELGSQKRNPRCESQSSDGSVGSAGDCRLGTCILNAHAGTEDQPQGDNQENHLNNPSILTDKKRGKNCHINLQNTQADNTPWASKCNQQGRITRRNEQIHNHHSLIPSWDRLPEVHPGSRAMEVNQRRAKAQKWGVWERSIQTALEKS